MRELMKLLLLILLVPLVAQAQETAHATAPTSVALFSQVNPFGICSPRMSAPDTTNCCGGNPELTANFGLRNSASSVQSSNLFDLRDRQFLPSLTVGCDSKITRSIAINAFRQIRAAVLRAPTLPKLI